MHSSGTGQHGAMLVRSTQVPQQFSHRVRLQRLRCASSFEDNFLESPVPATTQTWPAAQTGATVKRYVTDAPRREIAPVSPLKAALLESAHATKQARPRLNTQSRIGSAESQGVTLPSDTGDQLVGHIETSALSISEHRAALAHRRALAALKNSELLEMHPDRLAIQQDLLSASSVGRVLALCSAEEVEAMDNVNMVTAVHRIAKLHQGSSFWQENPRFVLLMDTIAGQLEKLSPRSMIHLLWAIARLQHFPRWLPDFLSAFPGNVKSFSGRDLSVILGSLSNLKRSEVREWESHQKEIQELMVGELRARLNVGELQGSTDIACVAAALSRLQLRDEQIFAQLADTALRVITEFSMSDIVSVLWAFASMNFTHSDLLAEVRQILHQQAEACSPKELTQMTWALSRLGEADEELLTQAIAPVVRAKLLDFEVPRDLCTLAFAFSNAKVVDEGLFSDIAHILSAKVRLMNAHDVSSVIAAFATIEYAHKGLFKALRRHTKAIIRTFTPLQLARTIHGLGIAGVEDPSLYRQLCDEALKKSHLLQAKNIVEILIGLAEAELLPTSAAGLIKDCQTKWLDARECIQALHALSRLPLDSQDLQADLMAAIRTKAQGWWRFQLTDMADLVEAMVTLKLHDGLLLNLCLGQMPRALSSDPHPCFLRLWGALSELPSEMRERVQERLHRSHRLREAVSPCIKEAVQSITAVYDKGDVMPAAKAASELFCVSTSLSWEDSELAELAMMLAKNKTIRELGPAEPWWPSLIWAFAELGFKEMVQICLREPVQDLLSDPHASLRMAAALLSLGYREWPDLSWAHTILEAQKSQERGSSRLLRALSLELQLAAVPSDVDASRSAISSSTKSPPGYTDRLSQALIEMGFPHEKHITVAGVHDVDIALPGLLLLVLRPHHLTLNGHQLASSGVRKRQLEDLGWTCKEVKFTQVETAIKSGSLHDFLRLSLNKTKLHTWQCAHIDISSCGDVQNKSLHPRISLKIDD